jgi:hypothetical protein
MLPQPLIGAGRQEVFHLLPEERPDVLARLVTDFLTRT